jgi:hypothetical protein
MLPCNKPNFNMIQLGCGLPLYIHFLHGKYVVWLFCENLKPDLNLLLNLINLTECAKLQVSQRQVRNCTVVTKRKLVYTDMKNFIRNRNV